VYVVDVAHGDHCAGLRLVATNHAERPAAEAIEQLHPRSPCSELGNGSSVEHARYSTPRKMHPGLEFQGCWQFRSVPYSGSHRGIHIDTSLYQIGGEEASGLGL
jgi:hypothetical protein